jgi:hypothetical protein
MGVVQGPARVRELDAVGELSTDRDGRLGLTRDVVVAVLQPQPVPVHRRLQVTLVAEVDDDLGDCRTLRVGPGIEPLSAPARSSSVGRVASGKLEGSVGVGGSG